MDVNLYTKTEYFAQLTRDIANTRPRDRVVVATMTFIANNRQIDNLYFKMRAAAKRGVDVTLLVDAYSFLTSDTRTIGPLMHRRTLPTKMPQPFADRYLILKQMESSGCKVVITNMPGRPLTLYAAGRSHIKGAVVNDKIYIGGCNLTVAEQVDIMLGWQDRAAADWFYAQLQKMAALGSTQAAFQGEDLSLAIADDAKLLLDSGKPNQSLILDEAYKLIDSAQKHIFLTCQYFPGGKTAQHLKAAFERGVRVEIIYGHPSAQGIEAPAHHLYAFRERTRLPQQFFANRLLKGQPKLHAKVLATEQGAMVGSHNYVVQGVKFGTAEVALLLKTADLSDTLRQFIQKQLPV
jgi:phosphatidylserine/phosphatidylglycerophosphate/cardiolipin synthase-like enzyme